MYRRRLGFVLDQLTKWIGQMIAIFGRLVPGLALARPSDLGRLDELGHPFLVPNTQIGQERLQIVRRDADVAVLDPDDLGEAPLHLFGDLELGIADRLTCLAQRQAHATSRNSGRLSSLSHEVLQRRDDDDGARKLRHRWLPAGTQRGRAPAYFPSYQMGNPCTAVLGNFSMTRSNRILTISC